MLPHFSKGMSDPQQNGKSAKTPYTFPCALVHGILSYLYRGLPRRTTFRIAKIPHLPLRSFYFCGLKKLLFRAKQRHSIP